MFVQIKKSAGYQYIYIIESYRTKTGSISHRTLHKLGRLDDFIKDDPQALEKLKAKIRENSAVLRNAYSCKVVGDISSISKSPRLSEFTSGYPRLNYANFALKSIWTNMLRLEYRFNYLQKKRHQGLNFSLSDMLFRLVVLNILGLDATAPSYGHDVAVLGDYFLGDNMSMYSQTALSTLSAEETRITTFVIKTLTEQLGLPFLKGDVKKLSSADLQQILKQLSAGSGAEAEIQPGSGQSHPESASGSYILSMLRMIVMHMLRHQLREAGHDFSYGEISEALKHAELLVQYQLVPGSPILYVKAGNGENVRRMNLIMQTLGLMPLLNLQDRLELSHRLKVKFANDAAIIPTPMLMSIAAG